MPEGLFYWITEWSHGGVWFEYDVMKQSGDTVLNGTTYHKIYHSNNDTGDSIPFHYIGGMRQDTALRQVYFLFDTMKSKTEVLLYDFNCGVGDSIKGFWGSVPLSSVSSKTIFGQSHRWLEAFAGPLTQMWVEGIGSFWGLFPHRTTSNSESGYRLSCFCEDGQYDVIQGNVLECDTSIYRMLGIYENHSNFVIFPNPVSDKIYIEFKNTMTGVLTIIGMNGNEVFSDRIQQDVEMTVDVQDHWVSGLYILNFKGDSMSFQHRIVIDRK